MNEEVAPTSQALPLGQSVLNGGAFLQDVHDRYLPCGLPLPCSRSTSQQGGIHLDRCRQSGGIFSPRSRPSVLVSVQVRTSLLNAGVQLFRQPQRHTMNREIDSLRTWYVGVGCHPSKA